LGSSRGLLIQAAKLGSAIEARMPKPTFTVDSSEMDILPARSVQTCGSFRLKTYGFMDSGEERNPATGSLDKNLPVLASYVLALT
jgi:hypothetical protein